MAKVYRSESKQGFQAIIDQQMCDTLQYCRLGLVVLDEGEHYRGYTGDAEVVLVVLAGRARIAVSDREWASVGLRRDVFDGKAESVYVGIESDYQVTAVGVQVQVAVCGVKATEKYDPFFVPADEVVVHRRGTHSWQREVHDIIADSGDGRVQRIVIGETYGDAGGWSSYPPHKHDEVSEHETKLEEIYFYQLQPKDGFAVQLLYTEDGQMEEAHIVRSGDSFAIDRGYHPVTAAGGYRVYYLWFLGGENGRILRPFDQPAHRWLHDLK